MFRRIHFSDLPAISALWGQAFGDSPEAVGAFFDAFTNCISYAAEIDGRIAAMVHAIPQVLTGGGMWASRPTAYLYAVATDEAYRGRGLCRGLMAFAEDDLKNRGFACYTLTPGEPSLFDFYEKMGYEAVFIRRRTTWDGVGTEISPAAYAALRESLLTVPHISYDVPTLDYLQKAYGLSYYKTPNGCAAASPDYTAEVLPSDIGGAPFAMVKWLGTSFDLEKAYLGFSME